MYVSTVDTDKPYTVLDVISREQVVPIPQIKAGLFGLSSRPLRERDNCQASIRVAKDQALQELKTEARERQADAILGLKYEIRVIADEFFAIIVYGTAVSFTKTLDTSIDTSYTEGGERVESLGEVVSDPPLLEGINHDNIEGSFEGNECPDVNRPLEVPSEVPILPSLDEESTSPSDKPRGSTNITGWIDDTYHRTIPDIGGNRQNNLLRTMVRENETRTLEE